MSDTASDVKAPEMQPLGDLPAAAQTNRSGANLASVAPGQKRGRKVRRQRQRGIETKEKRGRGRPSDFRKEYSAFARKLAVEGYTDKFLANFFSVSLVTLYSWERKHARFFKAIQAGRNSWLNLRK